MGGYNSTPTPSGGGEFNPALDGAGTVMSGVAPPQSMGFSLPQPPVGGWLAPAVSLAPSLPLAGGFAAAAPGPAGGFAPDLSAATPAPASGFYVEQTGNFGTPRKVEGLKPDLGRGANMPLKGSLLGGSEPAKPAPAPNPLAFKPDPLAGHTVNAAGRAEHQNWARLLSETNDYRGALPVLNRAVKDFGVQGQGDVGNILGHLNALAPKAAQAVQDGIFQGTGIRVQPRLAPDGPGFDPESAQPALPKTNPWGSAEGADPQAAADMAKVLLTKGDYAQGAVPHFQGEFARDLEAARAYTAAIFDEMAKSDPQAAALFAHQMGEGGLVQPQDPTTTINDLGKRALGGDADAVRDLATTYTDLLNADEAAAAKVAQNFEQTYGVPIEAAFELGKPADPAAGRSYSEAEVLGDWKGNVEGQAGMRLTEAASRGHDGAKAPTAEHDENSMDGYDAWPQAEAEHAAARSARTEARIDDLGFEVVDDDHDGPLTGAQVTRAEYEQMVKEANNDGQWSFLDAGQWWAEKKLGTPPQQTNLAAHKDQWVRDHATTIKVTARRHGIPPEVLAGIVHTETGGMPDSGDDAMNVVRSVTSKLPGALRSRLGNRLAGSPNNISAGDVSIQLRNVAKIEGIDPDAMDMATRATLIDRLQSDKGYALDMAARYVKESLRRAYPEYGGGHLDEKQVITAGYAYNLGYPHPGIDPKKPHPTRVENSSYGPDLARKLGRMRELLGGK